MQDEGVQAMVIMATISLKTVEALTPLAQSVVGASMHGVSALGKASADTIGMYLRNGQTTLKAIEATGAAKFIDITDNELSAYKDDLMRRGVRFNIEDLGRNNQVRLWYVASDIEKIKASIIDAGARFVDTPSLSRLNTQEHLVNIANIVPDQTPVVIGKYEMDKAAFDDWLHQAEEAAQRWFREEVVTNEDIIKNIEYALDKPEGSRNFKFEGEFFDVDKALADQLIKETPVEIKQELNSWRNLEPTGAQAYTIDKISEKIPSPREHNYATRGEASDIIRASINHQAPSSPPTPEQLKTIEDMVSSGRLTEAPKPTTILDAHQTIEGVLKRESLPIGGSFASVKESIAYIQGKQAEEIAKVAAAPIKAIAIEAPIPDFDLGR